MDDMLSRRKDLPEDLACFLQQQKQRQARLETTMRSFPSTEDMEQDKNSEFKKKRNTHEVRCWIFTNTVRARKNCFEPQRHVSRDGDMPHTAHQINKIN